MNTGEDQEIYEKDSLDLINNFNRLNGPETYFKMVKN